MTTQEKLTMAHALEDLGVDIIEAGFAMASEGDFAAIATITQAVRKPRIASLARAKTEDIEMAARALQFADRARIHVFLASSDLHLEYKLKISRAEALDLCGESVRLARSLADDVEFSPEDATRSDRDFLVEMVRIAVEAGATTINMPDTVGYSTPEEYGRCSARCASAFPPSTSRASSSPRTATTIWAWPWPTRWPPSRRRAPGGVHHQRHRRAGRQRRS
jgi:2-isopropylmalate synthase